MDITRRRFLEYLLGAGAFAAGGTLLEGCARTFRDVGQTGGPAQVRSVQPATSSARRTAAATQAEDYDLVEAAGGAPAANVRRAVEALGGMGRFVHKGDRVLIKPNLLCASEPKYGATTNPLAVAAAVRLCRQAGASDVVVADNPTDPPEEVYAISGLARAVQNAGGRMKILTDRNFQMTAIPKGRLLTQWPLLRDVFESDVFINMPVAKDHGMARLTMAMKNMMGTMGGSRSEMHIDFQQKIVDLNTVVVPHLVLLDAYRILVRNGPTGGSLSDVRTIRRVVAGRDNVSVDAYVTRFFGLTPKDLPYLVRAASQGLGEIDMRRLKVGRLRV